MARWSRRANWVRAVRFSVAAAVAATSLAVASIADAGVDFAADSQDWNGLAGLLTAANGIDVELDTAGELDFSRLDRHSIVVLLGPDAAPTAENIVQLKAFIDSGGRLIVADDFRSGRQWAGPFGIDWLDQPGQSSRGYDNNRDLPIVRITADPRSTATARSWHGPQSKYTPAEFLGHNIKDGVVLNHPAALRSAVAATTAVWGVFDGIGGGSWLIEAGRGRGRVLAVADSSLLINQMISRLYDNRQFAANLLRYYCVENRSCKVTLIANLRSARGTFSASTDDRPTWRSGLDWLSTLLAELAELLRGPLVAPALLAMVLLMVGLPVLRRARTAQALLPPRAETPRQTSALAQKLQAWLREPMADYRKPAQLLANQLERLLERVEPSFAADRAQLAAAPQRRSGSWRRDDGLVDGLVRGGRWSQQAGQRLRQVLNDLRLLAQDHAPMVSRQQFGQLAAEVEWAESLLRHTVQHTPTGPSLQVLNSTVISPMDDRPLHSGDP
ncbi:MAG: DUF4350 domain-containing protein [Myxococcales bacterium]|nr:DUF4350 domain-containing protein [Myxococcales bacterium]